MVVSLSEEFIKALHQAVLDDDPKACRGYKHKGMVKVCMERAVNVIYGEESFKTVVEKAAALMFSINAFHPFNDGCRRTSLLVTYFFLLFNGYHFVITEETVTLTSKIATGEIKDENAVALCIRHCSMEKSILGCFGNVHGDEPFLVPIILLLLDLTKRSWV